MESTRELVLRFIRGHREATVAQLAAVLGLSQQAVRRHLDGLRADGYLDARLERHGVGRPTLVYTATERVEETAGRTYLQLLSRLFHQLEPAQVESVFAGIASEVAADHAAEVRGETLDQRVAEVSHALEREGIVDGWRSEAGAYHLVNNECPYLRLAEMSDAPCKSDLRSIELLVGASVEQTSRIVDGAQCCEYVVRQEPVTFVEEAK